MSTISDRKLHCERHMKQRICDAKGRKPKNPPQAIFGRIRAAAEAKMNATP